MISIIPLEEVQPFNRVMWFSGPVTTILMDGRAKHDKGKRSDRLEAGKTRQSEDSRGSRTLKPRKAWQGQRANGYAQAW